jgi:hypothetical protein
MKSKDIKTMVGILRNVKTCSTYIVYPGGIEAIGKPSKKFINWFKKQIEIPN